MTASNIIFMDGFDHYNNTNANLIEKWFISNAGLTWPNTRMSVVDGRYGGGCLKMGNQYDVLMKYFPKNQYLCTSFAFQIPSYPTGQRGFFNYADGSTDSYQIDLRLNTNGTISMTRGGTVLTGGTSTYTVPINCWNWMEVKAMISNSITANSCQVKINGVLVIDIPAGQDTQNTVNSYASSITFRAMNDNCFYDDIILQTGIGSDFIEETCIATLLPSGNGYFSNFTGNDNDSSNNYLLVSDTNPDYENTYVESDVIGGKDLYSFPTISTTANSIVAIGADINCRKSDIGFKQICSVARINSIEQDGPTIHMHDTYAYQIQDILPINPETGLSWSQSEAEALQLGQKVIS